MRRFQAAIWPALLAMGVAAGAQTRPVPDQSLAEPAIVVTGERAEQAKAAAVQARAVTQPPPAGKPLARHYLPVCLRVFGLSAAAGTALAERVRSNIRGLGLRTGGSACQPNAWIGLISNSRAQVAELRKREPAMFVSLKQHEIARIFSGSGAAQVLHATESKGVDGRPIPLVRLPDGSEMEINQQWKASRLGSTIRQDITGALVLFDRKLVRDKTLGQLADYATMRLLASTYDQAQFDPQVPTILTLFGPEQAAPDGLSEFDRAYLTALYRLGPGADHRAMHDATRAAFLRGVAPAD